METGAVLERARASAPPIVRGEPPPLHGGPLTLVRFLREHGMFNRKYFRLFARLAWLKLRWRKRLVLDGIAFVGPGVTLEIGKGAKLHLGRWSWVGHGTKIRVHEGEVHIGAKTVLGQECTISSFQHVSIGRECIVADRVMLIDFDHGVVEVDRPIREQGIYKRDVRVGNNVWMGYGACILRGATVGDNAIVGTSTVVTKDVPDNAVVAGVPAQLLRMRDAPRRMRWA
jgi:acetyltransferase-like isoleucine patch superfamily enzyme